jgi:hypothetical protein
MQIWITYIIGYWEVGAPTGLAAPGARHPRYATGFGKMKMCKYI